MKIIGIGLSRTGTTSLTRAIQMLGLSCVHYPFSIDQVHSNDAATDITCLLWLDELLEQYPDAKLIWTERELDSWLASCAVKASRDAPKPPTSFMVSVRRQIFGADYFDETLWRSAYARNVQLAERLSRNYSMIKMNICDGNGWEVLCPFLGKPIPSKAFPWEFKRSELTNHLKSP